jgi:nucleoid DNA-binding protein
MRKKLCWGLAGVLAVLGLTLVLAGPAQSQRPPRPPWPSAQAGTLPERVAASSGVNVKDVEKVLRALGPEAAAALAQGQILELPGFGKLRVVRVPDHRDLDGGRAVMVPGSNNVEFLPAGEVVAAANAPGAVPAVTVPPFQYNPITDRVPSTKIPDERVPSRFLRP